MAQQPAQPLAALDPTLGPPRFETRLDQLAPQALVRSLTVIVSDELGHRPPQVVLAQDHEVMVVVPGEEEEQQVSTTSTAVRNVSVISVGTGGIHPEHMYGTRSQTSGGSSPRGAS